MPLMIPNTYISKDNGKNWEYKKQINFHSLKNGDIYTGGVSNKNIFIVKKDGTKIWSEEYKNFLTDPPSLKE
ncbi:MAG: hypothetical protein ACOCP8_03120 [archaeon]